MLHYLTIKRDKDPFVSRVVPNFPVLSILVSWRTPLQHVQPEGKKGKAQGYFYKAQL
jgi:hypothetical protein